MHSRLENYLMEVAGRLGSIPVSRRDEELREVRQHLLNAVTVNQEMGQSEAEAAQTALEQFGTAEELAQSLTWAWRREEQKRDRRQLWRLIAITAAFCLYEVLTSPHDLSRLAFAAPYILLALGCRKWAFSPTPRTRPWAYACAALMLLHPFSVPHLLWTHVLTQLLNFLMVGAIFYLRFREQRVGAPH